MVASLERRLTLHQLRIFKTVVDHGHFTRAAEALALSQPAVTQQLQGMRRALGQALFQPGRGSVELTPLGELLYARAVRILALVQETGEAIEDLVGLRQGRVRVAGDTTVGTYVLPDALAAFHRLHPGIALTLDVVNRSRVRELMVNGEADLGVVGRLWDDEVFEAEPLLENELICLSNPDHPLVSREPLRAADLLEGPLLIREPGSGTRESTEEILRMQGVTPVAAMALASNGALKRAVAGGLGVTVLSAHAVRLEIAAGVLRPLRVEGFPVHRTWHVVWPRERVSSHAALAFRDYLQSTDWRLKLSAPLSSE